MARTTDTIDSKIQSLEKELAQLKKDREKQIEYENLSGKYNGKYFYSAEDNYSGTSRIYYHIISAQEIINNNQLKFIGTKNIFYNCGISIERSFIDGTIILPINNIIEISESDYTINVNPHIDYINSNFKK